MNELAVIALGKRQYIVTTGANILTEKIEGEVGTVIKFDQVLLYSSDNSTEVGTPTLSRVVTAKIVAQTRGEKVTGMKAHPGGRRRVMGHRQPLTKLEITSLGNQEAKTQKAEVKEVPQEVKEKPARKKAAKKSE